MAVLPADQTIAEADGKVTQAWRRLFDLLAKPAAFSVHKNGTAQTSVTTGVQIKLTWSTALFNLGSYFDLTNGRWKPPAGVVQLQAAAVFSANVVDQSQYGIYIYKNGSVLKEGNVLTASGTSAVAPVVSITDQTNGSDYYEVYVLGTGAGDKTISGVATNTWFCGSWRP